MTARVAVDRKPMPEVGARMPHLRPSRPVIWTWKSGVVLDQPWLGSKKFAKKTVWTRVNPSAMGVPPGMATPEEVKAGDCVG